MTAHEVIQQLARLGVTVSLEGGSSIALESDSEDIEPQAIALARQHKQDLLTHLHACSPHNNPARWNITETCSGPIAHCSLCGRFIGYVKS